MTDKTYDYFTLGTGPWYVVPKGDRNPAHAIALTYGSERAVAGIVDALNAQASTDDLAAATARAEAAETDHDALVDTIDRLLIAVYDLDGFKKCPEVIDHAEAVMRPHDLSGLVGELREKRGFNAPQEQGDD